MGILRFFKTIDSPRASSLRVDKMGEVVFAHIVIHILFVIARRERKRTTRQIHRVSADADGISLRLLVHSDRHELSALAMTRRGEEYSVRVDDHTSLCHCEEGVQGPTGIHLFV